MCAGQNGDAHVKDFAMHPRGHSTILREPALGDVQLAEDFDAADGGIKFVSPIGLQVSHDPIDAHPRHKACIRGFDVDV